MESGLSSRMQRSLSALASARAAAAAAGGAQGSGRGSGAAKRDPGFSSVDLAGAQNEVLRGELEEFLRSVVEEGPVEEAFALPPPNGGDPRTRSALAGFFNSNFRPIHRVGAEQIVLTAGASDALESLVHAVCDDGDSVLVPGPYWHGFGPILNSRANVNIIVAQPPTPENYANYLIPSLQAAYDFSADHTRIKAVIICNPHNPLARCYPKSALLDLMEFCQEKNLHLVVDEIYALTKINGEDDSDSDDGEEFVSALELTEPLVPEGARRIDRSRVHVVWSASKLFGMSGFRMGCIISQQNPHLLNALSLITTNHTNGLGTLYLSSLLSWSRLPTLLALNSERLTVSYRILASALHSWNIPFITPTHGIFLFARLAKHVKTAEEEKGFYDAMAVQGVSVGQGRFFTGAEWGFGWARIRFAVKQEVMQYAIERLSAFLDRRK